VLNDYPDELEAVKCKAVAQLQLSKFFDVVSTVDKSKYAKYGVPRFSLHHLPV
jgi:hypothetical protein